MSDASNIKSNIQAAMKEAMRAKDKDRLGTVRLILAAFKQVEVDERIELDDGRVLAILSKMLKQRRDAIAQFQAADRNDLADKEQAEVEVIQSFMPAAMDEAAITQVIAEAITVAGATSMKDMGSVMNIVRDKVQGRADMTQVSAQVKAQLSAL